MTEQNHVGRNTRLTGREASAWDRLGEEEMESAVATCRLWLPDSMRRRDRSGRNGETQPVQSMIVILSLSNLF